MPRCGDYTLLQYQNADTTKFCNEKADITNFIMKKGETMNFGSAKKRTLQSFVMKKADTTKFKGDNTKLYKGHYKTVCVMDTTNLGASVIVRVSSNFDPNVTRVTYSDTASFFIPQPPPSTTTSAACHHVAHT